MKNAAEEKSPGTAIAPGSSRSAGSTVTRVAGSSPWIVTGVPGVLGAHRRAGGAQHPLGVVAGRARLDHARRPVGEQARPAARTTSPGRWRPAAGTRSRAGRRRATVSGGSVRRAHSTSAPIAAAAPRPGRPGAGGSTRRRRASTAPAGWPASQPGQQPQQRAGVADVDRRRPCAAQADAADRAASAASSPRSTSATSAPSARDRGQRWRARVGRRRGSSSIRVSPSAHRGDHRRPVRDRLVGRRRERAAQRPRGLEAASSLAGGDQRDDVAELADDRRGALGLRGARRSRSRSRPVRMSGAG